MPGKKRSFEQSQKITHFFSKKVPKIEHQQEVNLEVIDPPYSQPSRENDVHYNEQQNQNQNTNPPSQDSFDFKIRLNEGQKLAATQSAKNPVLILAGAGTGKTTTLLARVYSMITQQAIPPWQILVVTFTNKAAKELRERLSELYPPASECTIATFHSFCYKLLSRYYSALGFSKKPTVISSNATILSIIQHCYKWLQVSDSKKEIITRLNLPEDSDWENIIEAVKRSYPEIYSEAHQNAKKVAGFESSSKKNSGNKQSKNQSSGKLSSNQRYQQCDNQGNNGILNQKESESQSYEIQSTTNSQPQNDKSKSSNQELKFKEDISSIYSVELLEQLHTLLIKQFESRQTSEDTSGKRKFLKICKEYMRDIEHNKSRGESFGQLAGNIRFVYQFYQEYLKAINAVDFNDMIILATNLFQHGTKIVRPNGQVINIPQVIRGRYRYLLVDEFQDCNVPQLRLIECLQGSNKYDTYQQGQNGFVTVVGDDAQSIYGFRGSYSRIFQDFLENYKDNNADYQIEFPLKTNYRSRPAILTAGINVIKDSMNTGVLLHKTLTPTKEDNGRKVAFWECGTAQDEAEVVANEMQRLHEEESVPYEDMASLNRCFKYGMAGKTHEPLQEELSKRSIPFTIVKDFGLFQREISMDICAYLTLICDSNQDQAFVRILNKPPRQLGKKFLDQLLQYQDRRSARATNIGDGYISLMSVAQLLKSQGDLSTSHSKSFEKFSALLKELKNDAHKLQVADVIEQILNKTGLFTWHEMKKQKKKEKLQKLPTVAEKDEEEKSDDDDETETDSEEEEEKEQLVASQSGGKQVQQKNQYSKVVQQVLQAARKFLESWEPQFEVLDRSFQLDSERKESVKSLKLIALEMVKNKVNFVKLEKRSQNRGLFPFLCEQMAILFKCGYLVIADFVAHAALVAQEPQEADKRIGVQISTIHAAKGLEYDTVFVMKCNERMLPTEMRYGDLKRYSNPEMAEVEHLEEEKRLAHVALTRAKERLYLTSIRVLDQGGYFRAPEIFERSQFVKLFIQEADVWTQEGTKGEMVSMQKIEDKQNYEMNAYGGFLSARYLRMLEVEQENAQYQQENEQQ